MYRIDAGASCTDVTKGVIRLPKRAPMVKADAIVFAGNDVERSEVGRFCRHTADARVTSDGAFHAISAFRISRTLPGIVGVLDDELAVACVPSERKPAGCAAVGDRQKGRLVALAKTALRDNHVIVELVVASHRDPDISAVLDLTVIDDNELFRPGIFNFVRFSRRTRERGNAADVAPEGIGAIAARRGNRGTASTGRHASVKLRVCARGGRRSFRAGGIWIAHLAGFALGVAKRPVGRMAVALRVAELLG